MKLWSSASLTHSSPLLHLIITEGYCTHPSHIHILPGTQRLSILLLWLERMHSHTGGCNSAALAIWTARSANTTNKQGCVSCEATTWGAVFQRRQHTQTAKDRYLLQQRLEKHWSASKTYIWKFWFKNANWSSALKRLTLHQI